MEISIGNFWKYLEKFGKIGKMRKNSKTNNFINKHQYFIGFIAYFTLN